MHTHISMKVMGIKGRRVHIIEELSSTIISFQRGKHVFRDIFRKIQFIFNDKYIYVRIHT